MTTRTITTAPPILIIIVTWNKKQYILELLASLAKLDYPSYAYEILVIDNASTDGTKDAIAKAYPNVILLYNEENIGGTGGFNTGLKWAFAQPPARYQYLWLLDNDVLVHRRALAELVSLLETKPDVAVAGSTMMQLDYPWRINEMGSFVNLQTGHLIWHRHLEVIPSWQGYSVQTLLTEEEADLTKHLVHCQSSMDVDYVAAASLLIRTDVAKEAGLWRDYFIHFDDVEWCLRIAKMGYRVTVSAKSLIWHLSAIAKVPTWILYYDNRNILDLMKTHGANKRTLKKVTRYILKKAVYYHLIGKSELAELHRTAVTDFKAGQMGKKEIKLAYAYQKMEVVKEILFDPKIKKVLISWTVNLQATGLQEALVQAMLKRPELKIDFLTLPGGNPLFQMPRAGYVSFPKSFTRWKTYWQLRGQYDLVVQSDYQPSLGLSWLKTDLLFVNDEGFCRLARPKFLNVLKAVSVFFGSFLI
ncbi:glycosyltransferase family 2 protein [Candidatus Parabeggiatoa sp. HSG14]|uniref:glycosyltransferase family 2 protein n=1 Tax=Candidatus Parabeggiatoa sp. HSG14 TaxID=3055593 RepID=UPI0025A85F4D|nr:glycosyltransferase family 2 protein [Thiotrichales bacterium HSG14]